MFDSGRHSFHCINKAESGVLVEAIDDEVGGQGGVLVVDDDFVVVQPFGRHLKYFGDRYKPGWIRVGTHAQQWAHTANISTCLNESKPSRVVASYVASSATGVVALRL